MRLWLPLIVLLCAAGAVFAYLEAEQRGANEAVYRGAAGWATLDTPGIQGRLASARNAYALKVRERQTKVRGQQAAVAWVTSLAQGARKRGPAEAPVRTPQRARLAGVREFVDGLPAARVAVSGANPRWQGAVLKSPLIVQTTLRVTVPQSLKIRRVLQVPIDVTLSPGAPPVVIDARATRSGLAMFADPVIVESGAAVVLAAATRATSAREAAAEAGRALTGVRETYPSIAGPRSTFIVIEETRDQSRAVLGRTDTPTVHPTGFTYENGDVVLVWPELAKQRAVERTATVWHEVTHVVTLPLFNHAPTLVLEGLATVEEARHLTARSSLILDLSKLRAAFRNGSLRYQELLHSDKQSFGRTDQEAISLGYLAGFATISHIDDRYGHPKLLRFLASLRSGLSVDEAIQRILKTTPRDLEQAVRVWVANYDRRNGTAQPIAAA